MFIFFCNSCEDRCPFHTRTCAHGRPACAKHCRFPKEKRAAYGFHGQENPWLNLVPEFPIPNILNSMLLCQVAVTDCFFSPRTRKKNLFYPVPQWIQTTLPLHTSWGFPGSLTDDCQLKMPLHSRMERREPVAAPSLFFLVNVKGLIILESQGP